MSTSQHISETAFIVDDSISNTDSIILDQTSSSELPSLDFALPDENGTTSFKKYGKRKSISLDNIYLVENESKIIKLDDSISSNAIEERNPCVIVNDNEPEKVEDEIISHEDPKVNDLADECNNYGKY